MAMVLINYWRSPRLKKHNFVKYKGEGGVALV